MEPQFIDALSKEFKKNTGAMGKPEGLMKVINEEAFDRIVSYTEETGSVIGGRYNRDELSIEPTIIRNAAFDSPVMNEEIFGPVMPIICVKYGAEAETFIKKLPTPLALYVFSSDLKEAKAMMKRLHFGGGCINDVGRAGAGGGCAGRAPRRAFGHGEQSGGIPLSHLWPFR